MLLVNSRNIWESQKKKQLLAVSFSQISVIVRKIEKIQKRCLRAILNDYESNYETLLRNSSNMTMEIKILWTLAAKIFKTRNEINPIFTATENPNVRHNKIIVKCINTSRFGTQSLRFLVPKI